MLQRGERGSPRGLPVSYLINQTVALRTGVTYRRQKDNPLIGFMEGLQFIAGVGDLEQIARIAPRAHLEMFSDMSIYGPRAGSQVDMVVEELKRDPYSRRAVITLPSREEALDQRPCTSSLQFVTTNGVMNTIVSMRSSDAVYGLPYDLIQFGMLAETIAICSGLYFGNMIVNIGNAHVYDSTRDLAKNYAPWTFGVPAISDSIAEYRKWALSEIPLLTMDRAQEIFAFRLATSVEKELL